MIAPYYQDDSVTLYHGDCREIVPALGRFDLLLTDPPYGIGADNRRRILSRANKAAATDYGDGGWDDKTPDISTLNQFIGATDRQIIWGGNYFLLPPCKGPLIWDKLNTGDFADGEIAWNNLGCAVRIFRFMWNGMLRDGEARGKKRFHPTQKPVELVSWCIKVADKCKKNEAKTILDPFAGSGTTGRAAKDLGRKCVLVEREERYCEIAANRMRQECFDLGV